MIMKQNFKLCNRIKRQNYSYNKAVKNRVSTSKQVNNNQIKKEHATSAVVEFGSSAQLIAYMYMRIRFLPCNHKKERPRVNFTTEKNRGLLYYWCSKDQPGWKLLASPKSPSSGRQGGITVGPITAGSFNLSRAMSLALRFRNVYLPCR